MVSSNSFRAEFAKECESSERVVKGRFRSDVSRVKERVVGRSVRDSTKEVKQ